MMFVYWRNIKEYNVNVLFWGSGVEEMGIFSNFCFLNYVKAETFLLSFSI